MANVPYIDRQPSAALDDNTGQVVLSVHIYGIPDDLWRRLLESAPGVPDTHVWVSGNTARIALADEAQASGALHALKTAIPVVTDAWQRRRDAAAVANEAANRWWQQNMPTPEDTVVVAPPTAG